MAIAAQLVDQVGRAEQPFVDAVLYAAGQRIAVPPDQVYDAGLHHTLATRGALIAADAVLPGDIAFFRDTLDLNGNRRPDDGITLSAVVERVEADRVILIARRAGRVRRLALSPARPAAVHDAAGRVLNTRIVQWPGDGQARTTGQCFESFGRP